MAREWRLCGGHGRGLGCSVGTFCLGVEFSRDADDAPLSGRAGTAEPWPRREGAGGLVMERQARRGAGGTWPAPGRLRRSVVCGTSGERNPASNAEPFPCWLRGELRLCTWRESPFIGKTCGRCDPRAVPAARPNGRRGTRPRVNAVLEDGAAKPEVIPLIQKAWEISHPVPG